MASNHHEDEIFKAKRRPKNPIKFNITLNEEQKAAKEVILSNPVTVLRGMAGSGKTLVAVQTALDLLFTGEVEKIIIPVQLYRKKISDSYPVTSEKRWTRGLLRSITTFTCYTIR